MIWIILLIATILRLINLNQSLWLDEAINVLATIQTTFWDMLTKYPIGDFHPPGYFALLWIWTRIGGIGEIWVRVPSVIFGVATVWLVYLLGKEMISKRVGILAALFMALAPLHVYYSQEARMYSLAAFSATLSFYFFWKLIHKRNWGDLAGFGISSALVLYSDYVVYLILPVQFFYLILWERKNLKSFLVPWLVSVIFLLPWLTVFPKQLEIGTQAASSLPGWKNVVGGAGMKELLLIPIKSFFGRVSLENKWLYGLVSGGVGIFYGGIMFHGLRKMDRQTYLLIGWLTISIVLAFTVSFFIPVLSYFRMIFILPAFYLLLAKGVDVLGTQARPGRLAVAGICMISLVSLFAYYANPKFQREDWRSATAEVEGHADKNSKILFENSGIPSPYKYYAKKPDYADSGLKKIPAADDLDIKSIGKDITNIYLFEYLVDITDPKRLLEKHIEGDGYRKIETLNFDGVGFVHHFQLQ